MLPISTLSTCHSLSMSSNPITCLNSNLFTLNKTPTLKITKILTNHVNPNLNTPTIKTSRTHISHLPRLHFKTKLSKTPLGICPWIQKLRSSNLIQMSARLASLLKTHFPPSLGPTQRKLKASQSPTISHTNIISLSNNLCPNSKLTPKSLFPWLKSQLKSSRFRISCPRVNSAFSASFKIVSWPRTC